MSDLGDQVRHEVRHVVGDEAIALANAHPGGDSVDEPAPDDRVVALERRQLTERLVDEVGFADRVASACSVAHQGDALAFARVERLLGVLTEPVRMTEVGRQQVRMVREEFPEDGEQSLVGQHHVPGGFHPEHVVLAFLEVRGEGVLGEVLPRIQLEDVPDGLFLEIDEALLACVPSDVAHAELHRLELRLHRRLHEIEDRHAVLEERAVEGEVHGRRLGATEKSRGTLLEMAAILELRPLGNQPLMERVELVSVLPKAVLDGEPLDHRGLEERGGRIRVVLEELRRMLAVVTEIEAIVDRRMLLVPALEDERDHPLRDAELTQSTVRENVFDRLEVHVLDGVRSCLDLVDLSGCEGVDRVVPPIRDVTVRVVEHALGHDPLAPVGPLFEYPALQEPKLPCAPPKPPAWGLLMEPARPKPPRETDTEACGT